MKIPTRRGAGRAPSSEDAFRTTVEELAARRGWLVNHQEQAVRQSGRWATAISRYSTAGFPDTVLVRAGVVLFVEFKADGKYPTASQRAWLEALDPGWGASQGKGCLPLTAPDPTTRGTLVKAYVWRPRDWGFIRSVL